MIVDVFLIIKVLAWLVGGLLLGIIGALIVLVIKYFHKTYTSAYDKSSKGKRLQYIKESIKNVYKLFRGIDWKKVLSNTSQSESVNRASKNGKSMFHEEVIDFIKKK